MDYNLKEILKYNGGYFLRSYLLFSYNMATVADLKQKKMIQNNVSAIIRDYKTANKIVEIQKSVGSYSGIYKLAEKYSNNIFSSLENHTPEEIISRLVWMSFVIENKDMDEKMKYFKYTPFNYKGITFILDDFKTDIASLPKNISLITLPYRVESIIKINQMNYYVPNEIEKNNNIKSIMSYVKNNFKFINDLYNDDKINLEKHEKYIEVYNVKYLINEDVTKEKFPEIETSAAIYNQFLSEFGLDPELNSVCWTRANLQHAIDDNRNDEAKFRKIFASYKNLNMFLKDFI